MGCGLHGVIHKQSLLPPAAPPSSRTTSAPKSLAREGKEPHVTAGEAGGPACAPPGGGLLRTGKPQQALPRLCPHFLSDSLGGIPAAQAPTPAL